MAMNPFTLALLPVMLAIVLGAVLRTIRFISRDGWAAVEKLIYYVLFPALLLQALAGKDLSRYDWEPVYMTILAVLLLSSALLVIWFKLFSRLSAATFTSVFQGGVRFNTVITLSLAWSYFGEAGLVAGSFAVGFLVLTINVLSVLAFLIWGTHSTRSVARLFKELLTNPLILACLIGGFMSVSGLHLPALLDDFLQALGRAALPLGLLAVGAALDVRALRYHFSAIIPATVVQFVVKPLAAFFFARYFGLGEVMSVVLLIAFMTPTAPASYILSRQMGGDAESMASIISFQTFAAFAVMPLWFYFLVY